MTYVFCKFTYIYFQSYICRNLAIAGTLMAYLNSAINPYLYGFLGGGFKDRWMCVMYIFSSKFFFSLLKIFAFVTELVFLTFMNML